MNPSNGLAAPVAMSSRSASSRASKVKAEMPESSFAHSEVCSWLTKRSTSLPPCGVSSLLPTGTSADEAEALVQTYSPALVCLGPSYRHCEGTSSAHRAGSVVCRQKRCRGRETHASQWGGHSTESLHEMS